MVASVVRPCANECIAGQRVIHAMGGGGGLRLSQPITRRGIALCGVPVWMPMEQDSAVSVGEFNTVPGIASYIWGLDATEGKTFPSL